MHACRMPATRTTRGKRVARQAVALIIRPPAISPLFRPFPAFSPSAERPMTELAIDIDRFEPASLTKAQLADLLYERIGLSKRESKDIVDAFFDLIARRLIEGESVRISGFGNFQVRSKAPRPGRNPRTGEAIPIEARRVVTFHASNKLKDKVQQV